MRTTILTIGLIASSTIMATAQCQLGIKHGDKLKLNIKTWNTPFFVDMKFTKMKEAKQDEVVAAYNARVMAQQEPMATTTVLTYAVNMATIPDGDEYTLTTNIAGTDYSSYMVCRNDTLFIARNRGMIEVPDGKGGIYGVSIQGVQTLPLKVKVGDVLPTFDDVSFAFPATTDMMVKKKVFSHNQTSSKSEFGIATDSRTGETFNGAYTKTTTSAVYKNIDVAVRQTLSTSMHMIHNMHAQVTEQHEITLNGTNYTAYLIDSQSWSKSKMDVSYESADAQVAAQQKGWTEKMIGKVNRIQSRRGLLNDQGYVVLYKREWFVPALGGHVRVEAYDQFGAITSFTELEGLGK